MKDFSEGEFYNLFVEAVDVSGTVPNVLYLPIRDLMSTQYWTSYAMLRDGPAICTPAGNVKLSLGVGGPFLTTDPDL